MVNYLIEVNIDCFPMAGRVDVVPFYAMQIYSHGYPCFAPLSKCTVGNRTKMFFFFPHEFLGLSLLFSAVIS